MTSKPESGAPPPVLEGGLLLAYLDVTDFSSAIHLGDARAIADAISTIREHHPNEPLWVEG